VRTKRGETTERKPKKAAKLNIVIDGSPRSAMGLAPLSTAAPQKNHDVNLNFKALDALLLKHLLKHVGVRAELGERHLVASLFVPSPDFDAWPDTDRALFGRRHTKQDMEVRNRLVQTALDAGYSGDAVYRIPLRKWMLRSPTYHEDHLAATVSALLAASITRSPNDYHCVVTDNADILAAVRVACPQSREKLFIAAIRREVLFSENRRTMVSTAESDFRIPPFVLADHVSLLAHEGHVVLGSYVFECARCHEKFTRHRPIPAKVPLLCASCSFKR
jgi:hypothetical protein